jgi:GNAT superfamily N-acetyltransferase
MTTDWPERAYRVSFEFNRAMGRAMERLDPKSAPAWRQIGTGFAHFGGDGSPLTQASWLGYGQESDPSELDLVEAFYEGRTRHWEYVVHPFSGPRLLAEVVKRGWTHSQYEHVMGFDLSSSDLPPAGNVDVGIAGQDELADWADISTRGFFGDHVPPAIEKVADLIASTRGTVPFLARLDGQPVAAAALLVHGPTCYLGGAATLEPFRGRGAQTAMLNARLSYARDHGCDLALCECLPRSQSQRNQERAGFKVLFTKAVLTRPPSDLSDLSD